MAGASLGSAFEGPARAAVLLIALASPAVAAQSSPDQPSAPAPLVCESPTGARQHCPADTSSGIVLVRSTGTAACLLGKTWGYDDTGVWVTGGCGGAFLTGAAALAVDPGATPPREPTERIETWGEFDPGDGFLIGRNSAGELSISGYAMVRYLNQSPGSQTFTDHLGNEHVTDGRNDIFPHRVIVYLKGWLGTPKLIYTFVLWTVNTTDQDALFGVVGYQFDKKFCLYAGINGTPGTRSLQGSHPLWLGHDRVMADEFFRPYFAFGTWAQGQVTPGLWYNAIRRQQLQLARHQGCSAGSFDVMGRLHLVDADHEGVRPSRCLRRLGNARQARHPHWSVELVQPGRAIYRRHDRGNREHDHQARRQPQRVRSRFAGPRRHHPAARLRPARLRRGPQVPGIFLQTEIYTRWLGNFQADGPLPVSELVDKGFYVQAAFFPVPKKLELYGATSQIYGDKGAGFANSSEYLVGMNYYPANTRDHRLNLQLIDVNRSPVSSTFGYYSGGQDGTVFSAAFSVFF